MKHSNQEAVLVKKKASVHRTKLKGNAWNYNNL